MQGAGVDDSRVAVAFVAGDVGGAVDDILELTGADKAVGRRGIVAVGDADAFAVRKVRSAKLIVAMQVVGGSKGARRPAWSNSLLPKT